MSGPGRNRFGVPPVRAAQGDVRRLVRREPGTSLALVVTDVASGLAVLTPPLALAHAVVGVVRDRPILVWATPLFATALLTGLLRALRGRLAARLSERLRRQLTTEVYESVQRLDPSVRVALPDGSITQLVTDDVPYAAGTVASASLALNSVVVLSMVGLLIVVLFPPGVIAFCAASVTASALVTLKVDAAVVRRGRLAGLKNLDFVAQVGSSLSGRMMNEVRLLGVERWATASLRRALDQVLGAVRGHLVLQGARDATLGVLLGWCAVGAGVVAVSVGDGVRVTPVLWAVFLIRALEGPLTALVDARSGMRVGALASARLAAVEALGARRPPRSSAGSAIAPSRALDGRHASTPVLVMEDVAFTYPDVTQVPLVLRPPAFGAVGSRDATTLCGIGLTVAAGQVLAIVGPSGSGKSTLGQLAAGLLAPTRGRVLVGGEDTGSDRFVPGDSVALVTADPWIADASVLDNVGMADPDAPVEAVVEACTLIGLDVVAASWGAGLDVGVGFGGGLLSTGERQRVALARAVLKRPRLLVLDEATSGLDVASERQVWPALRTALPDAGIVVISHRVSTALLGDTVAVLEGGRLVSYGDGGEVGRSAPFRTFFGLDDVPVVGRR